VVEILLVEDDPDQALLARRALSRHDPDYRVSVVDNGQACLSALSLHAYDVALLDYRLPRTTGLKVLRQIRQAGHTLPIIVLTAYGDEKVAVEAMKAGVADYVIKQPGYLEQLANVLDQVLHRHRLETELTASQQRYRLLFESSRDAILILNDQDQIIDLNPSAESMLGVSCTQVVGGRFLDQLKPEQADGLADWYQQLRAGQAVSEIVISVLDRRGQRLWIEIGADRVEQTGRVHYQILLRDVTQSRRDQAVWDALNRAALIAHNELDPMTIYRAVAHVLLDLGLSSSLWWLDQERQALQVRYTTYIQEIQDQFAAKTGLDVENLWVPVEQLTVFRDRVRHGETVYIKDGSELIRQIIGADEPALVEWVVEAFRATAAVILPLTLAGKVAGIMLIHGELSPRDVPAAQAFAAQISAALEHARLYEDAQRHIRELAALHEISFRLGSTLDLEALLQAITQVALQLTRANNCHIYLVEKSGFKFGAALRRDGSSEPAVQQPRREGLVAQVAQQARPLFIVDAKTHPLYRSEEAQAWGVESIAGCPLLRSGQVLGVFTLTYLEPHSFDQVERHILSLLADQAAVAVETAQLYKGLRVHNQDLSTLYQVALAVSAQLNISDVLETAYQAIHRTTGAKSFAVGLYDEATDELVFKLIREEGQDVSFPNLSVSDGQALTAWVARNRQELLTNDMENTPLPAPGITVGPPVRSWLGLPLIAAERLVGVMVLQSFHADAFDESRLFLCRNIATQVAIALEKARLIEETQQRNWELSVLNKVSAVVSHSFDLETLLDNVLDIVLAEMRLSAGSFHLLDEVDKVLTLVSQRNFSPQAVQQVYRIAPGEGMSGKVLLSGEPIVINDYGRNPRRLSEALADHHCFATLPLASKDAVVGVLSVLDRAPRELTAREVGLLVAIGQQIGVAVESITLYRKTIDRERRLARLYEAARSLSSVLEARQIFQRVLETAVSELSVAGALLWLHDPATGLHPQLTLGAFPEREGAALAQATAHMEQVLKGNQNVLWSHPQEPQQWVGADYVGKQGYRAAVPLRGQASEVGVLEVITAGAKEDLTASDVEFMSALANIASITHENAQLYDALAQYAISLEAKVQERTAEVRREKEQTEAILHSVADAIFVLNSQSKIVRTNPAGEVVLAASAGHSARLAEFLQAVARQPSSDAPGPTITLNGKTFQARAAKIHQEEEELGTVLVLRDVTHFEEVNRLKSQFVSTVSHELRTPLSNLKLYLSLLQRGREEKRETYQQVMSREVNRLESLIEDLLDLSRLESRERRVAKERLDLREVISHVVTVLTPQVDAKTIQLVTRLSEPRGPLWVQANREQMIQLVMNLTANAIHYTEPGGRVTLGLGRQTDSQGDWITFAVEDTGVGIPPGDMPQIFDRFFRGQVQQHMSAGTGLGLAIVKEILEQHNGWITVKSEVGVGSLFTVGLPAVK